MKFITSSTEFFELHNNPKLIKLRESILAVPIDNWKYINTLKFKPAREISKQEAWAITSHQIYLLENFDSISEINRNESLLTKYGYKPVSLTLEGAYLETLESLNSLNESLADSVKSFLLLMTDGGNALGIVHFVLDIMSLIPGSWFLFPFDVVASLLNALIYIFQDEPSYIMAAVNLVFAFAGPIGGGIKLALKPFIKGAEKLFALVFKGAGSSALIKGAMEFKAGALVIDKAAASAGGIIPKLGDILKSIGTFILGTGLAIINSLMAVITKSIKFVSLGFVDLNKILPATKLIDELVIKMTSAGKAATEAGELLIKQDAAAAALITKAEVTAAHGVSMATAAGKDLVTSTRIGRELELGQYGATLERAIKATDEWKSFMKGGPTEKLQARYLINASTEKLIGGVLNSKSPVSLINLMKSPEISAELAIMGFRPGEVLLMDAIKAGDSSQISIIFNELAGNANIMEHIIAKEPAVAKTISIFKEAPDALIAGTKNLKAIQKTLAKLSGYRSTSLRVLIGFIVKQCMKGTDCGKLLVKGSPDEILSHVSDMSAGSLSSGLIGSMNELLSKIVINEDADPISEISADDLEQLKTTNPDAYKLFSDQSDAATAAKTDLIKKTKINPCQFESTIAQHKAITILMPKGEKGRVAGTDLITPEDFKNAQTAEHTKSILTIIQQDTHIDPQHPISSTDPEHIAYLADVFSYKDGALNINESPTSKLDETLDLLIKDGKLHPDRREEIKKIILNHWKDGTVPESFSIDDINLDESFFKIGKLITRR